MYSRAAEAIDVSVKTQRTIRDRLSALQLKGFLDVERENRGEDGGRYDLYEFGSVDPGTIADVLEKTDQIGHLFKTDFTGT
jgi:hypothetical protein